jgi:hypothetical protein
VVGATIAGGGASGGVNSVTGNNGAVGGGYNNTASGDIATVGGGGGNTASADAATVTGGLFNLASGNGAMVAGGEFNVADADNASVGGGYGNRAGGLGSSNPTVGGGYNNTASGDIATVGGGWNNIASGNYSFAAGVGARAIHNGAFVWADSTGTVISSTRANQMLIRASGGVTMYTDAGATAGVALMPSASSWTMISDRNAKANFERVDGVAVLNALMGIPIETWNYHTQDAGIRHMGPMAQDFSAAFGLGETDTGISTVDADGVALAAIQGLYAVMTAENAALAARVAALEAGETAQRGVSPNALPWLLAGVGLGAALALAGRDWMSRAGRGRPR